MYCNCKQNEVLYVSTIKIQWLHGMVFHPVQKAMRVTMPREAPKVMDLRYERPSVIISKTPEPLGTSAASLNVASVGPTSASGWVRPAI